MKATNLQQEPAPVKILDPAEKKGSGRMIVVAAIVVVAIIIIALVAYAVLMKGGKEGLKASVSPEALTLNAGASQALEATASWNGDSIDDAANASFSWSVSNASLGGFSGTNQRSTVFQAGHVGGSGVITCNITYVSEDGTSYLDVDVNLVVNAPTLALVKISPSHSTLVFDRAGVFNVTAEDSVGDEVAEIAAESITWSVSGVPETNCTLNATHGASVNITANVTGTITLTVSVTVSGVTQTTSVTIYVIKAAPTLTLADTKLPAGAGINWTLTAPTEPLDWDELSIILSDGTSTVNWSLTMEGLDNGTYNVSEFGPRLLGSLTVFLNITDVDGNGAVNATDFFLFTTSGGKFSASGNYVITLVYEPTEIDVVAELPFNG